MKDNGEALFNKQKTGIQINKEYLGEVDVRMFCRKTSVPWQNHQCLRVMPEILYITYLGLRKPTFESLDHLHLDIEQGKGRIKSVWFIRRS